MLTAWLRSIRRWRTARRLPRGAVLPARSRAIHRERPDLQAAFDLSTARGRADLFWWYLRHGFAELGLRFDPAGDAGLLPVNRPYPPIAQKGVLPITWLMHALISRAPHGLGTLRDAAGHDRFLAWFFLDGLADTNLLALLDEDQARALLSPDPIHPAVPRLLAWVWSSVPGLATRFASPDGPQFRAWCAAEGSRTIPILSHPLIALATAPPRRPEPGLPFGVNLFGHSRARSGLGEDVRMAAQALTAAGVPFVIRNVAPGAAMPDEEAPEDRKDGAGPIGVDPPYPINLYCMTAEATLAAAARPESSARTRYNIGFWPWELPELPELWRAAYDVVDEIWASSQFTYAAYCRSSPRPVRHMPMAVTAAESAGMDRAAFGLPEGVFLFGFAFDALSTFARKAPEACVRAFQQAFPAGDEPVGLVIKTLRVQDDPRWQELVAAAAGDARIRFIARSLPRGALLDLWRTLDCFVSMHRSEGFGRNIAEAMLLGKPVMATAHSGNMDFTLPDTAALVPVRLRPVQSGEYPFGAGQVWADPDIAAGAKIMRRLVEQASWRENIAARGCDLIATRYNPHAVGTAWAVILREIHARIGADEDRSYA